jgi:hypothetical protein
VLHTHSRRLDFHPHVHLVVPAAAIDAKKRLWRTKKSKANPCLSFLMADAPEIPAFWGHGGRRSVGSQLAISSSV